MEDEHYIVKLLIQIEKDFEEQKISAEEFWSKMNTYSLGKGHRNLPKSWHSKVWKNKRESIIKENANIDGFCNCKKCGIETTSPVIQHHRHPRKFGDILYIEKNKIANEMLESSFKKNGHNFFHKINKCRNCGSRVKFLPYTKKWQCTKTGEICDSRIQEKKFWSLWEYKRKFLESYMQKDDVKKNALNKATEIYISESRGYRELNHEIFPYFIYCKSCAFEEDLEKGKIKKKKKKNKVVDNSDALKWSPNVDIDTHKPQIRIRRKK